MYHCNALTMHWQENRVEVNMAITAIASTLALSVKPLH